jgi:hypothetical protein
MRHPFRISTKWIEIWQRGDGKTDATRPVRMVAVFLWSDLAEKRQWGKRGRPAVDPEENHKEYQTACGAKMLNIEEKEMKIMSLSGFMKLLGHNSHRGNMRSKFWQRTGGSACSGIFSQSITLRGRQN